MSIKCGNITKDGDRISGQIWMEAVNTLHQYIEISVIIDKLFRSKLLNMIKTGDSMRIVNYATKEIYILQKLK